MIQTIQKTLAQIPSFKKVVVGISGGPDSVALAFLLNKLGYRVSLAHVNHNTRNGGSDEDQQFVETLAKKWNLPLFITQLKIAKKGNFENQARQKRYEFFEEVRKKTQSKFIAVGHHSDDQIETILMHIKRGSGQKGLCGMYTQNHNIIRPLLGISKPEILEFLKKNQLDYKIDSTNQDLRFERNKIRHQVIPQLEKKYPKLKSNLLKLSDIAQKRFQKNQQKAKKWIDQNIQLNRFERKSFAQLNSSIQSHVIFLLTGYEGVYKKQIEEIKRLIEDGESGKKKRAKATEFQIEYNLIRIKKDSKKTTPLKEKPLSQRTKWGESFLIYNGKKKLKVRTWKAGDRFQPNGMTGEKKLQDFFVDEKIPRDERGKIPIIVNEKDEIYAIGNLRVSKKGRFLKEVLKIETTNKST